MSETSFRNSAAWKQLRGQALRRDAERCTISRLLGGTCSARLHVHHLIPVSEGGPELPDLDGLITVCSACHPRLEAFRRAVMHSRTKILKSVRCPHTHRSAEARQLCERRLARQRGLAQAA